MTSKVFVGNLAFQTTDQALAEAFKDCGKVNSGVIITRGRRSLGYGFVDFATAEDAANAVQKKNQTEFLNRVIKVELVRDPPPPRPPRQNNSPPVVVVSPSGGNNNDNNVNNNENVDYGEGGAARRRQKRPRRRRGVRRPEGGEQQLPSQNPGGGGLAENQRNNNNNNNEGGLQSDTPPPRRGRQRRNFRKVNDINAPPKEKILSKTAVFVANLPFVIDDDSLKQIFEKYNVKTAHVVKTRTQKSRGYGFVDFATEADQQAAIKEKNDFLVIGANNASRKISVTVSHSVAQHIGDNNTSQIV